MIEPSTLSEPLLSLPLPRYEVQHLSMETLCRSITASPELSSCEIQSMDRFSTMLTVGFRHRFLLFQIKTNYAVVWARLDRLWPINASIAKVIKGAAANDHVRMAEDHGLLHDDRLERMESSYKFSPSPRLEQLGILLEIVHEYFPRYSMYPYNCWSFCSVIEESLICHGFGRYTFGTLRCRDMTPEIRERVKLRYRAALLSLATPIVEKDPHVTNPTIQDLPDEPIHVHSSEWDWLGVDQEQLCSLRRSYLAFKDALTAEGVEGVGPKLGPGDSTSPVNAPACTPMALAMGELIALVVKKEHARAQLVAARGKEASSLMQGIQTVLDKHSLLLPSSWSRREALRLLQDISSSSGTLPEAYTLQGVAQMNAIPVARGGEADIFRGIWAKDNVVRDVVLRKIFLTPTSSDIEQEEILRRIRREVITHRQLSHRNIVPFLGVWNDNDHPLVIVTPWCPEGDAIRYIQRYAGPGAYVRIVLGIASALQYLHSQGPPVIHGDLHGRNVLIDGLGNPQLCDFGFSRIRHEITRARTAITEGGSWRHMAPELTSGQRGVAFRTSEKSDIYAFAMTVLELGTGAPPFKEYDIALHAVGAAGRGERPARPKALGNMPTDHTDQLWAVLERMWSAEASERPGAGEVVLSLSFLAENHRPTAAPGST